MLKNKKFQKQSGFGLIELMVSISIVVLVTSVILARNDSYNGAILLRSQAYDIALKIREVQMQAVSVVGQGEDYRTPLGVCFNTMTPNSYRIFADSNPNGECEADEFIGQRGNIDPRFRIDTLNLISGGSSEELKNLVILFERPNFDARFFVNGSEETDVDGVEIGLVRAGASNGSVEAGDLRVMEISRTGQILVQSVLPPCEGKKCRDNDVDVPPPDCERGGLCDSAIPPEDCEKRGNCNVIKGSVDSSSDISDALKN